jgi:hypothetical protein
MFGEGLEAEMLEAGGRPQFQIERHCGGRTEARGDSTRNLAKANMSSKDAKALRPDSTS